MSFFAVAAVGSAVVGAGASIISGNKAAKSAKDTATQNNALQQTIYNENKATLSPFVNAGSSATNSIQALLGLGGSPGTPTYEYTPPTFNDFNDFTGGGFGFNGRGGNGYQPGGMVQTGMTGGQTSKEAATAAFDQFRGSTGYQFRLDEGNKGLTAALGKNSMLDSGAAVKSAIKYNQNVGSDEFSRYLGALQGQQALGAGAASAQAGVGTNFANASSANNNNASAAQQSAYLNTGSAINGALGSAVGAFGYGQGLKSSYGGGLTSYGANGIY